MALAAGAPDGQHAFIAVELKPNGFDVLGRYPVAAVARPDFAQAAAADLCNSPRAVVVEVNAPQVAG